MKGVKVMLCMTAIMHSPLVPAAESAPRDKILEGNSCVMPAEHTETVFLVVDESDHVRDLTAFRQTVAAVKKYLHNDKVDMRLVVGVITGKSANMRIVVDLVRPGDSLLSSTMLLRKNRKAFEQCFDTAIAQLADSRETYKTSAILETLKFFADLMHRDVATKRKLVIYSDMVQNSETLSLYGKGRTGSTDELISRVESAGLRPTWEAVEVYVVGIGGTLSESEARRVEEFWRAYFTRSGATLRHYGPILTGF